LRFAPGLPPGWIHTATLAPQMSALQMSIGKIPILRTSPRFVLFLTLDKRTFFLFLNLNKRTVLCVSDHVQNVWRPKGRAAAVCSCAPNLHLFFLVTLEPGVIRHSMRLKYEPSSELLHEVVSCVESADPGVVWTRYMPHFPTSNPAGCVCGFMWAACGRYQVTVLARTS
jgi:hypothetical protein